MEIKKAFVDPLQVEVKYSLRDYYEAVSDHAPQIFKDLDKAGPTWLVRTVVPTVACAAAIFSKKLKPHYRFIFSNDGISREANSKTLKYSWSEITRVRIYGTFFMVELKKGAMPVPFRFLNEQQLKTLREAFSP